MLIHPSKMAFPPPQINSFSWDAEAAFVSFSALTHFLFFYFCFFLRFQSPPWRTFCKRSSFLQDPVFSPLSLHQKSAFPRSLFFTSSSIRVVKVVVLRALPAPLIRPIFPQTSARLAALIFLLYSLFRILPPFFVLQLLEKLSSPFRGKN